MKKQIKLIASTLVFTTLLTANTFAISNNSKNESIFDNNKVGTFYFNDSAKAMNNPFFYETEQDPWSYQGSQRISQKDASNQSFIYSIVSGFVGIGAIIPGFVMIILGKINNVGEAGTVEFWKSEKRQYKTSQITGERQLNAKWALYRMRLTSTDGEVLSDTTRSFKTY